MKEDNLLVRVGKRMGPWGCVSSGCGCMAVLVIVFVAVWLVVYSSRNENRIASNLASVRAAGLPVTAAELDARYQLPPDAVDTTHLWLQATKPLEGPAFEAATKPLPTFGESEAEIPPPGEPWPDLAAVEAFLEKYSASLDLLHEAAELGGAAQYPNKFSQGLAMALDHVDLLRQGARLLRLESHAKAHRGDPEGAARSIHALFTLAGSLEREPVIVSQLVRIGINGMTVEQIRRLLQHVDFSEADLRQFQQELRSPDYRQAVHEGLIGKRVTGIQIIENPAATFRTSPAQGMVWRFTQRPGLVVYLDQMDAMLGATTLPWPDALATMKNLDATLQAKLGGGSPLTRFQYLLPGLLLPALDTFLTDGARATTYNDLADAAIGVELFRRQNGNLPEGLEQLVPDFLPEVPTDPFDGKPLRYRILDDGYLLYSVGADGVDQGGEGDLWGYGGGYDDETDLVFRVAPDPPTEDEPGQEAVDMGDVGNMEDTQESENANPPAD